MTSGGTRGGEGVLKLEKQSPEDKGEEPCC